MNKFRFNVRLFAVLTSACLVSPLSLLRAQAPTTTDSSPTPAAPGTVLYKEDFNKSNNPNGWYVFGGGKGFTYRGDVVAYAGPDSSNAYVITCTSDNTEGGWYGGIARNGIFPPNTPTTPEHLVVNITLFVRGARNGLVTLRFVQGDSAKPSWATSWKIPITQDPKAFSFVFSEGKQTGTFDPQARTHLHPISFGQGNFGKQEDLQIIVDDVSIVVR